MKNIYLEPDEEIISIIDRIVQTNDEQINLIIPAGAQIWQSSINLKLLRREANNLKKDITLVVANDLNIEMAEKTGFTAKRESDFSAELAIQKNENQPKKKEDMIDFLAGEMESEKKSGKSFFSFVSDKKEKFSKSDSSIKEFTTVAEKSRKRMVDIVNPSSDIKVNFFSNNILKNKPVVEKKIVSGLVKKKDIFKEKFSSVTPVLSIMETSAPSKWPKIFAIFVILAFVAAVAVGYVVLPTMEVFIFPKKEKISFDLLVIGSKDPSYSGKNENQIYLKEIEVNKMKSGEFSSTGEKELNKRASGFITIYNEYSSSAQPLVARTRFESPDGKVFRITEGVTVPGAKIEDGEIIPSTIKVKVTADQPGDDYNIGPTDFTIPGFKGISKFVGFYGKSEDSMEGGIVGKAKIVLAEDIEKAEEALTEELKNEIKIAFDEQIPSDLKIIKESLREEIVRVSSSVNKGEPAEKFTIEIEGSFSALLFREEELKEVINSNLISMISDDKTPVSQSQQVSWEGLGVDWDKGEVSFPLHVEEDLAWKIDIQTLRDNLAGQTEVEVRKYLTSQPTIESARVSFWPFWVKKVPIHKEKIKIIVDDYSEELGL